MTAVFLCYFFLFFISTSLSLEPESWSWSWATNLGLGLETLSLVLGLETQSLGLGLGLVDPSLDYITASNYYYYKSTDYSDASQSCRGTLHIRFKNRWQ